jgi:uncharacterized protein HemX
MSWVAAAIVTAVSAGTAVYSGEEQRKSQSKSLRAQREGQRQSLLRSVGQEKLAAQASAAANRKKPNIDSLLFSERARADMGPGSTLLAGPRSGSSLMGRKSSTLGG